MFLYASLVVITTYSFNVKFSSTYDHRILKIELPVCSAVLKQDTGELVVRWVTTGEYPLLYVFAFLLGVKERKEHTCCLEKVAVIAL